MKEILISSSVLIAAVLLLRWLFRGKVSHRLLYCAWLLVAARLLIPFQFGSWALSLNHLTDTLESRSPGVEQAREFLQEPVGGPSRDTLRQEIELEYAQQGFDTTADTVQSQIAGEVDARLTAPTVSQVLKWIWFGGMVVMGLWFFTTNLLYLHRARQGSVPFAADTPVPVRISANVPSPCLTGLLRPVIYLTPESVDTPQRTRHILTHELAHLKHGDPFWSLVRCVCLCVYWFHPLVWVAAAQSRRDCELACDERALAQLGDGERLAYGHTLLATVCRQISPSRLLNTATAMTETKKQLKERMCFIVKKPRNLMLAVIATVLVAALAAGCAFTGGPEEIPTTSTEPSGSTSASQTTTQPQNTEGPPVTQPPVTQPPVTQPPATVPPVTEPEPTTPPKLYFTQDTKQEDLYGAWSAHVRLSDAEPITYQIWLNEDGTVRYQLGLYGSELIESYTGTWKPAGEPYPENCYILEMTGQRCVDDQDYPEFNYFGVLEIQIAKDQGAIRACLIDGNFLFKFYNGTTLNLYRYFDGDDNNNYYDIPIQTIVVPED